MQRLEALCAEAPAGVGATTQDARVGAGDVHQNGVWTLAAWKERGKRRRIGGIADGNCDSVRKTAAGDVFAERSETVLMQVGGNDMSLFAD